MSGTTSFKPIEEAKIEPKDIIKEKLNDLYTLLVVSLVIVLIVVYAMPKFADKEQKIVENKKWICYTTKEEHMKNRISKENNDEKLLYKR